MFDIDSREDDVRPMLDGEFEGIHLGEDPIMLVKVGASLPLEVKAMLIECLQNNMGKHCQAKETRRFGNEETC